MWANTTTSFSRKLRYLIHTVKYYGGEGGRNTQVGADIQIWTEMEKAG